MGQSPLGAETPRLYYAAASDEGYVVDPRRPGQLLVSRELLVPDSEFVGQRVESFMRKLYNKDRYSEHNALILEYYDEYSGREGDSSALEVDKMAIRLHDFVDHAILHPEQTAVKLGLDPEQAGAIRKEALEKYGEILDAVGDKKDLNQAYTFAIDTSRWEAGARKWRGEATDKIKQLVEEGEIEPRHGEILNAVINKIDLDSLDQAEVAAVFKAESKHLIDLKLGAISTETIRHNVKGLSLKALETLVNIQNPPKNNVASTMRDCIEALSFFVPALNMFGYRQLATDLRGAALEHMFDDPNGDAKQQHGLSERYVDRVRSIVVGLREQEFGGLEIDTEHRVKTEGSTRQKLAEDDYKDVHEVSDGIGFAFIVPDEMAGEEMEQFVESFRDRLTEKGQRVISKHPHPEKLAFEYTKQKSGYEAFHMTFYYYPEDGPEGGVPFEIQVMTRSQYEMKQRGRSSDIFYQAGTDFMPEDHQQDLDRLVRRARAESELAPGSTVQSIAEVVALSPEIPEFVFNELFRAVNMPDGSRILVPALLEAQAHEIAGLLAELPSEPGDLAVLPSVKVTEQQFKDALSMFDRDLIEGDLINDRNIVNALKLVKDFEAENKRRDGKTVLEGHLLPVALAALMLTIQSGKIWESSKLGPKEYMSNIITITLLHDYVETTLQALQDTGNRADIQQKRREMLYEIKRMFGSEIMGGVDALTLPMEIEGIFERREQYTRNIQANGYARLIKPADRWQNHVTDLVKLVTGQAEPGSEEYQTIMEYFAKTDRHLSKYFTGPEMTNAYTQVHAIIWQFAKHFGYDPEAAKAG